jgi:carbonic anhydrase
LHRPSTGSPLAFDPGTNERLSEVTPYNAIQDLPVGNTGHGLQVNGNFSNIIVLEENYEVLQFHVHFPPEHAVDGALPAGELQGVHRRVGASGLDELLGIGLMSMLARRTLPALANGGQSRAP